MIVEVKEILEVIPYKVTMKFTTGEVKVFDFQKFFEKHRSNPDAVVHKLKDKNVFMQVRLNSESGTICWDNLTTMIDLDGSRKPAEYDPAPEVLYELSVPVSEEKLIHH